MHRLLRHTSPPRCRVSGFYRLGGQPPPHARERTKGFRRGLVALLTHAHKLVPPRGRAARKLLPLHVPRPCAETLRVTAAQAGLAIRASQAERKRAPSGFWYCSAGGGNPAQHLAVPTGTRFTRGASSCDLALQGSSLRSSGDPTPAARVHPPPKRSFFGAFPPIPKFLL